ncbi:MAG TPA: DUF1788 domain-containing protein [Leptospiraceae bacterium]|nr:DUF1788 domain-containing protein [Leptospiraceae bacterium]
MHYLDRDFDELIQAIKNKKRVNYTGIDPVFYLIYPPEHIITVKKKLFQWQAKLANEGFAPVVFSIADCILEIVKNYPMFDVCLESEKENPFDFEAINQSIKDILLEDKILNQRILEKLATLSGNQILLLTDLEALHPYLHISGIEADLIGKILSPLVIFYPGTRMGQSSLRFLGIHPQKGNYRSTHIGGLQ